MAHATWRSMILRCEAPTNASYRYYGAKGISVCERWRQSFACFLSDMGERPSRKHSIDRIDNAGNYGPDNCRWATAPHQNRHRGTVKLTQRDADAIRVACAHGEKQVDVAARYDIHQSHVSMIVSGKIWKAI